MYHYPKYDDEDTECWKVRCNSNILRGYFVLVCYFLEKESINFQYKGKTFNGKELKQTLIMMEK